MIAFTPILDEDWDESDSFIAAVRHNRSLGDIPIHDLFPTAGVHWPISWEEAEDSAHDANRLHSAYLTDEIIAERFARRILLKQALREAMAAASAKRKEALARAAEARRERARQAEERARLEEQWRSKLGEVRRWEERRRILKENWGCAECKGPAEIGDWGEYEVKYRLRCLQCGRIAFIEHERVMEVINSSPLDGFRDQ